MRLKILAVLCGLTPAVWAASGIAELQGTAPGSMVKGTVHFTDTPAGLQVSAQISNAAPGVHGFHIHEFGGCGDTGKAAGGHFNPMGAPHGMLMKDGPHKAHAGDMGNITVDANGNATLDTVLPNVYLTGTSPMVGGRAVILHEKADDFSQPTGQCGRSDRLRSDRDHRELMKKANAPFLRGMAVLGNALHSSFCACPAFFRQD